MGFSAAFDGTNYLVGIQGDQNSTSNITAQLISASTGSLVGSRISVGRTGEGPDVAFDGTNYLLVWLDTIASNYYIYGQLVSKAGQLVGSSFSIGQSGSKGGAAIIFDGANYFVVWDTRGSSSNTSDIYAQFVTPSGTLLGSSIPISTAAAGKRAPTVAFDGTNILVAWVDGRNSSNYENDIYGQFVAKSGASSPGALTGTNFAINNDNYPSNMNNISVAFDGTNYMVFWPDEISTGTIAVHGQLVTPAGAMLGGMISVGSGADQTFPNIAFDGTKYLVTWADSRNDVNKDGVCDSTEGTCWNIYGQYISTSGSVVGAEFAINADPDNQFGGVVGFNGGKYLILINDKIVYTGVWRDVYGMFMNP